MINPQGRLASRPCACQGSWQPRGIMGFIESLDGGLNVH